MTIYQSKKFEKFLGQTTPTIGLTENSIFGDWNGHVFILERKRCLIVMNNRTCYSVLMTNVQKKNLKDFGQIFKERLTRQLNHDMKLNESQEKIKLRKELSDIVLTKSNNDRKIIGTINHQVENLKYNNFGGRVEHWNEVHVTGILNTYLVGTKILPDRHRRKDFFRPIEIMEALIK